MKKLFILFSLMLGLMFAGETNAQTKIMFDKGASSKTLTVTIPAKGEKSYSLFVNKEQVINIGVEGDIGVSKTNDFPVIWLQLVNGVEDEDRSQDGEAYLSILTGRKDAYIFKVGNSSNRARTFSMKVSVTNDREDFLGGEEVEQ